MSDPFVGEIRMFAGNFAPRGWSLCDGQLLAIAQNNALFSLLGTIYGGDGRTTFGLPELRGRIPIHAGTGAGLSPRQLGAGGGAETASVTVTQLPVHAHTMNAASTAADDTSPLGGTLAASTGSNLYGSAGGAAEPMAAASIIDNAGGTVPHANVMPYLCVNFIIALFGIYPSRS